MNAIYTDLIYLLSCAVNGNMDISAVKVAYEGMQ